MVQIGCYSPTYDNKMLALRIKIKILVQIRGFEVHILLADVLWSIGASAASIDGDKVTGDVGVARTLSTVFRQKLPYTNKAALQLLRVGVARVMDSVHMSDQTSMLWGR